MGVIKGDTRSLYVCYSLKNPFKGGYIGDYCRGLLRGILGV